MEKILDPITKYLLSPVKEAVEAVCVGKALRVAPSRGGNPAASFWKFWVDGSEVYATIRSLGNMTKISVHASGQIHMRFEGKDLQQLAPPLLFGNGQWLHAFELRFLLSPDAYLPPPENLKNKRAILIEVPSNTVLIMNLLVGQAGSSAAIDLPHEFRPKAKPLWRATLKNQRPVVLTARIFEMDKQNRDQITSIRHEITPKLNFSEPLTVAPYVETRRVNWDAKGGNVVVVIPMGKEAFRVDEAPSSRESVADLRTIIISSPSASMPIAAPNGAIVGTLSIAGATNELTLRKNVTVRGSLGTITFSMNPSNLIFGDAFRTPSNLCPCVPTIDSGQPRNWEYRVFCHFDGVTLRAEIRKMSVGLRSTNTPMTNVGATEEILMIAPVDGVILLTTAAAPQLSAVLEASFLLRDI